MTTDGDAPVPEDEEEKKRRRRPIAWWWWAVGGGAVALILIVVLFSGDDDGGLDPNERVQAPTAIAGSGGSSGGTGSGGGASATDTPAPTDDDGSSSDGGEVPDIEGVWEFIVDVTETSGVCAGEEDESPQIENVTIRRQADGTYEVTGLEGESGIAWRGGWDGDEFVFNGERDEDGGITVAEFTITYNDGMLRGTEDWSWSSAAEGECPTGKSDVEAFFYAPLS